jgi:hypothetical protein
MKFASNLRAPKLALAMDMYASNFHEICAHPLGGRAIATFRVAGGRGREILENAAGPSASPSLLMWCGSNKKRRTNKQTSSKQQTNKSARVDLTSRCLLVVIKDICTERPAKVIATS